MKQLFVFATGVLLLTSCGTSETPESNETSEEKIETLNEQFDAKLAKELEADDYGMHNYVMAFLKSGPNRDQDSLEAIKLQRAHLDNIKRLADEGKLVVAGPFLDDSEVRGIYIFNVATVEEAEALTKTDPAIKAGRLVMELHPWYGSAALMQVPKVHKKVSKNEI